MKKITLYLLFIFLGVIMQAQEQTKVKFSYDDAGNRIRQQVIIVEIDESKETSIDGELYSNTNNKTELIDLETNCKIELYPNPTSNFLNIASNQSEKIEVQIVSESGQVIKKESFVQNTTIDLSNYSAGLYYIVLNYNDKQITQKIIKK